MDIQQPQKELYYTDHLVYSCVYHVIFCTKYRRKVLTEEVQRDLKELVAQKQQERDFKIISIETMSDHVHLLLDVNPKIGIFVVTNRIKGYTSHELRKKYPYLKTRLPTLWSRSKFISSVGCVSLETVKKYIEDQKNI